MALDASIILNAAHLLNTNLSNTGYEWPPLAQSCRPTNLGVARSNINAPYQSARLTGEIRQSLMLMLDEARS
jgi:hypothetical protein